MKRVFLRKNSYYDSVFLMKITAELKSCEGIDEVQVTMATKQNLDLLSDLGFEDYSGEASPQDLLIAISGDESLFEELQRKVDSLLSASSSQGIEDTHRPSSLDGALNVLPSANLALISLPGDYAVLEAYRALRSGLHCMLFSDNVSLEDERDLKRFALERGLLLMGPDCGTAIINGNPLCFANEVSSGPIGIVAASGTGAQEVSVLIDRLGSGCSQVIGTGGRDLKEEVGGITMQKGISALAQDHRTEVIVVISKPPAESVAQEILQSLSRIDKPSIVHFLSSPKLQSLEGIEFASTLEETALLALSHLEGMELLELKSKVQSEESSFDLMREVETKGPEQRYLRAYFSGGTLCDESLCILSEEISDLYSNIEHEGVLVLDDPMKSSANTLLDLGDDFFTRGRPHPMIDPNTRIDRMSDEVVNDGEIAVVMFDLVLGFGCHHDPAEPLLPLIEAAQTKARSRGNELTFIASIVGVEKDPQSYSRQRTQLEELGVIVTPSNARMAHLAKEVMKKIGQKR